MGRRTAALCLVAVAAAGGLAGCSTDADDTRPATADRTTFSVAAAPPTTPPSVAVTPRPVTPSAGRAPGRQFAVGVRKIELSNGADRPLPTTVWYPAEGQPSAGPGGDNVVEGLVAARGPFPLVLFSHGLTARPESSQAMLTRWAQAGFVVAAPAYPYTSAEVPQFNPADIVNQPADASHVITTILALNTRADDPLWGRIDVDRVAAAGHSAGGITTVGMLTTNRDDRLDAAVVLAGRRLLAAPFVGPPTPVLFVHGKLDSTVPYADGLAAYQSVPWSRAMLAVTNGQHGTTTTDFEVTVDTTTEFLRWSLYGDVSARNRIPDSAVQGSVARLTDEL